MKIFRKFSEIFCPIIWVGQKFSENYCPRTKFLKTFVLGQKFSENFYPRTIFSRTKIPVTPIPMAMTRTITSSAGGWRKLFGSNYMLAHNTGYDYMLTHNSYLFS